MAIDDEDIWKDEYEKLPPDPTGLLGPINLAKFVNARVTGKLQIAKSAAAIKPASTFTWNQAAFAAALAGLPPSPDPITPRTRMVVAWQAATLGSILLISPGAKFDPPPSGTNGIAAAVVAVIDPVSVAKAFKGFLEAMLKAKNAPTAADAVFPVACREAFTKLTYTISGADTSVPPTGPIPILMPLTPVE